MHTTPAIDAARQFLAVVWDGPVPADATLTTALDRLIIAYHVTNDAEPSDGDLDAPRDGGPDLFRKVGARFPDYGLYPLADPTDGPDGKLGWGDAIDDLSDIILDMREVIWLADNKGADAAPLVIPPSFLSLGYTRSRSVAISAWPPVRLTSVLWNSLF